MSDKPENNKEDPIIVKDTDDKMKCRAESMIKHLESSTRLPDKIMRILLSKEAPEAIWWLPKGDSFAIQMEKFQEEILMKYFRGNKFKSLVRNMHRWGFRRMTCDAEPAGKTVAFSHPYFREDKPELVAQIEMINEIKEKKPKSKKSPLKRGIDATKVDGPTRTPKVARSATQAPERSLPSNLSSSQDDAGVTGYHTSHKGVHKSLCVEQPQRMLQQSGSVQPTMQDFVRNSMLIQMDERRLAHESTSLSLPASSGMLGASRAPLDFRVGSAARPQLESSGLRSVMLSQLQRDSAAFQNESFMLQLLASQQRNLSRTNTSPLDAWNPSSMPERNFGLLQGGLAPGFLAAPARNSTFTAELNPQSQLNFQHSLVQSQIRSQINDRILHGGESNDASNFLARTWIQPSALNNERTPNQQGEEKSVDNSKRDRPKP